MFKPYDVDHIFKYHAPQPETADRPSQQSRYENLRHTAKGLAQYVLAACPESRERSLALTKLEESIMWANASIARNEPPAV